MSLNLGNLYWQARIDNSKLKTDAKKTEGVFSSLGKSIGKGAIFAGIGVMAGRAIKEIAKVNIEFEKSISSLSSLTGAVGDDLDFYKEKAIEFGSETTQSAVQVANAFKLVGSQKPELLKSKDALAKVTREAITLAEASGVDVPTSAKALTNALNQTGASARKSTEYINILASASKKGAGDIPYLNSALEKSAKVAHDSNLSFAEMTSVIEQLAPAFSEPSSAGLHFKAVLLRLQKQGYGFESGMFNLQDALNEVQTELTNIKDPAERSGREIDILGQRSITAGKIMLESKDKFKDFANEISGTNTAYEQARINTDNVAGSITKLKSAIEGIILKFGQAGGLNSVMKDGVDLGTEFVQTIGTLLDIVNELKPASDDASEGMGLFEEQLVNLIVPIRGIIKNTTVLVNGLKSALQFMGLIEGTEEKRAKALQNRVKNLRDELNELSGGERYVISEQFKEINKEFSKSGDVLQYITDLNNLIADTREGKMTIPPLIDEDCPSGYKKNDAGVCVKIKGSGNGNKKTKEDTLKELQAFELSQFLIQTQNAEQIKLFKMKQDIEYMDFKLQNDASLNDIQKATLENQITLAEKDYESKIEIYYKDREQQSLLVKETVKNKDAILVANDELIKKSKEAADARIEDLKRLAEQQKIASKVGAKFADIIEKSFEDGEFSAKKFKNALREVTIEVISMLVAQAVTKAAASAIEEFGWVGVALAPVAGAAAKVAMDSLIPKFDKGGYVTNGVVKGQGNKDTIHAMVKPNETITNSEQQANLLMAIANGGLRGNNTESLLKEQNELLRNNKDVIIKDNVMYVVQNGNLTGEKVYL